MKTKIDPRIDAYLDESADFARPILRRLRALVHQARPEAVETLKWGHPAFVIDGKILCIVAGFKAHCGIVFWHQGMKKEIEAGGAKVVRAMGQMGRIEKMGDLPTDAALIRYFRRAAELITSGVPARPPSTKKPRPELPVPKDLAALLVKNKKAAETFVNFPPSQRRDYIEWITEAKRDGTRQVRLTTTLEWLAQGKPRNWKYMNC